jgi:hypothetical protein
MTPSNNNDQVLISFEYALKGCLRNKDNYDVLEGFLSELLKNDITVKSIGESESDVSNCRVEILAEDQSGEIMLIVLQFTVEIGYLHRMFYGIHKTITEGMDRGDSYTNVKKVYSITIVYFTLGQGYDYIYYGKTHFTGLYTNNKLRLSEFQQTLLERKIAGDICPEYYILKLDNFDNNTKDWLDEWVYFLKHDVIKDEFHAKGLDKARIILARDKMTPEEQQVYDDMIRSRMDNLNTRESTKFEGRLDGRYRRTEIEALKKALEKLEKERRELEELEKLEKERNKWEKKRELLLAEIARLKQDQQK